MNNEPVAWMELYYGEPNNLSWTDAELRDSGEVYKIIPLYTHPVKELTDEEIIKTMVQFDVYSNDDQCLIEAGREILRKAQEQ